MTDKIQTEKELQPALIRTHDDLRPFNNDMIHSIKQTTFVRDRFTWLAYFMLAYYAYMQATLGPLMPFLRAELNLSYTVTGLHLSAFALGMVLAGFTCDYLVRRWGRYPLFWAGAAGMAAGGICLALSANVILTIGSTLLMGWLGSFLLVMIQAGLSDRHGSQRAVALTESNVAASFSASLAPMFIGAFQRVGLGWRGALFLGVVIAIWLYLQFQSEALPRSQQPETSRAAARQRLPAAFWGYWSVVFLGVSIEWCMIFWGADFLENKVGLSRVNAATIMSVFFIAMVLGRFVGSRLTRVWPGNRLLMTALLITLVGFPLFWLAPLAAFNVVGLFVTGLGVANLFPLTLSVAVGVAPQQTDSASARLSSAGGLAILSAPLILGWTADQFNIQNAYGLVILLLAAAIAVAIWASRAAQKEQTVY